MHSVFFSSIGDPHTTWSQNLSPVSSLLLDVLAYFTAVLGSRDFSLLPWCNQMPIYPEITCLFHFPRCSCVPPFNCNFILPHILAGLSVPVWFRFGAVVRIRAKALFMLDKLCTISLLGAAYKGDENGEGLRQVLTPLCAGQVISYSSYLMTTTSRHRQHTTGIWLDRVCMRDPFFFFSRLKSRNVTLRQSLWN